MKRLWLLLFTIFNLAWAQDLTLKKNDKTVTIRRNQSIEITLKDNDFLKGRFLKIENNSINLEGRIIAIDQIKQIKLPYSRFKSAYKGFRKGGLVCGGITAGFFGVLSLRQGFELDFFEIYIIMVAVPTAAFTGGTINAFRYAFKPNENSYKIDLDNWEIIAD